MPYSPLRSRLPAGVMDQRNRIAQTMMNIGSPPPQVSPGGIPPGMHMAPTPLKSLMGIDPGMSPGFMGGAPTPMPGTAPPPPPPPTPTAGPMPPPMPQTPPPSTDPSSLFAAPPTMPGQTPPEFAKPPVY